MPTELLDEVDMKSLEGDELSLEARLERALFHYRMAQEMTVRREVWATTLKRAALAPARPRTRAVYETSKRAMDILLSALALVLLAPLFLAIAIAIKWQDGGPVFFSQSRLGRHGKSFRCWKFRSMTPNADQQKAALLQFNDHPDARTFKMRNDPRITPVGRILRKYSLDEFPQFWNVLLGEMSLVGPRPAIADEVARYTSRDLKRLSVKPGLTCLWQVRGRGSMPFEQQILLDLEYVAERSLLLDLKLLVATVPAVMSCRGAY